MTRVFVVHDARRVEGDRLVPKFDFSPAAEYGEVEVLLSDRTSPFNPQEVIRELHSKLRSFGRDDYLLLVGNPTLIGWATTIAVMNTGGPLRTLQWHGKEQRYIAIEANLADW